MARGGARPGAGRPAGRPNKVTSRVRAAIEKALEQQNEKLGDWFDAVASEDPGRALTLYGQLAEYAAPKLARKEITGEDGAPIRVVKVDRDE